MGLKGLLLGHEVKVYYDRHLTRTEKAEDAENPSEYEILKGVVNGVYKDMILISYSYRENVQTTKKGLFSEKVVEEEKTVEAHSLINRKCIVRIDILDLNLEEEEEEYDEEEYDEGEYEEDYNEGEDSEQDEEDFEKKRRGLYLQLLDGDDYRKDLCREVKIKVNRIKQKK